MNTLLKVAAIAGLAAIGTGAPAVTFAPRATREALVNPGMGWVFYHFDDGNYFYGAETKVGDVLDSFPGLSTVYFRIPWSDLEPEEGRIRWDVIDTVAQPWIAAGKQICFRFTCQEGSHTYSVPKWVVDAGAKGALVSNARTVCWTSLDESFDFRRLKPTLEGSPVPATVESDIAFGWNFTTYHDSPKPGRQMYRRDGSPRTFSLARVPTIAPGAYTLCVSVGDRAGTPPGSRSRSKDRSDRHAATRSGRLRSPNRLEMCAPRVCNLIRIDRPCRCERRHYP